MVSQAIAAMEPVRALVRAMQRLFRAHENRNVCATKLRSVERITCGLLNGHVSCNRGHCQHADSRRAEGHDQGHGVIGSGVGIDQELGFHAA